MAEDKIGVLSVQGDVKEHIDITSLAIRNLDLDIEVVTVKTYEDLKNCDALIIPGGESTTIVRLLNGSKIYEELKKGDIPIMGTCAGAVILSKSNSDIPTLELIDMEIARNAWGPQKDSFETDIRVQIGLENTSYKGIFIRAPRILKIGPDCRALGWLNEEVVMVRQNKFLALTFHPELNDSRIHEYFIREIYI